MKKTKITFGFVVFIFFRSLVFAQPNWRIEKDSMNFLILISDYNTYEFEMGHFSVHQINEIEVDKLPFKIIETPAADYGSITFLYSINNDTLFSGKIIWQGIGKILFPKRFYPADSFSISSAKISPPLSTEYFYTLNFDLDSITYKKKADSAWNSIKTLDIVNNFSKYSYRIGFYLYQPGIGISVGEVFSNFVKAKWIIFLCIDKSVVDFINSSNELIYQYKLNQNYPNPFNPSTTIQYEIFQIGDVKIYIYDITGRLVKELVNEQKSTGKYSATWDGKDNSGNIVASGNYFYQIITNNFVQAKKMIFLK